MKHILIISLLLLTGCYFDWQDEQFYDCYRMFGKPTRIISTEDKKGVECWYHGANGPFMLWQRFYK